MESDRTGLKRKEPDHGEKDELPALRSYRAASRCALSLGRPPPGRLAAGCLFVSSGRWQLFGQRCVCRLHHADRPDRKRCGSGVHDGRRDAALSARIESRGHERPGRKNRAGRSGHFYRDRAGRPWRRHPVAGRRWGPCRRGERHRQRRIPEIRPLAQL